MHDLSVRACLPDDPAFLQVQTGNGETIGRLPRAHVHTGLLLSVAGRPAAGLCLYKNPSILREGAPTLQAGNFSCPNSPAIAKALLDAALSIAAEAGAGWLLGPMNGSTWEDYRFVTAGEAPPFPGEPQNPAYYPALWLEAGFVPVEGYCSQVAPIEPEEEADVPLPPGTWQTVGIGPANLEEVLPSLHPLVEAAFREAPFFSSISVADFVQKMLPMRPLVQPGLTRMITDSTGQAAAFILAYPDVLNPGDQTLIMKTVARRPGEETRGLVPYLLNQTLRTACAMGMLRVIHATMHLSNISRQRSAGFGGTTLREYELYGRPCR